MSLDVPFNGFDLAMDVDEYIRERDWTDDYMPQPGVPEVLKMDNYFTKEELNVSTALGSKGIQELAVTPLDVNDMLNMKLPNEYYFPNMNLGVENNITQNMTPNSSINSSLDFSQENIWDEITQDFSFSPGIDPFQENVSQQFYGQPYQRERSNSSMSIFESMPIESPKRTRSVSNPTPGKKKKVFYCHLCPTTFSRNHDLKRHIRIHLGIRPHKCQTCPKSFTRADALHRHVNVRGCRGV